MFRPNSYCSQFIDIPTARNSFINTYECSYVQVVIMGVSVGFIDIVTMGVSVSLSVSLCLSIMFFLKKGCFFLHSVVN